MDIPDIAALEKDVLPEGSTLYIASDEKKRELFRGPFSKYRLQFLQDFIDRGFLKGVNPNLHGMIEQVIASHADRFVGRHTSYLCTHSTQTYAYYTTLHHTSSTSEKIRIGTWWSTFTGYINRMRGYWGTDTKSWYYPKHWKDEMQTFHSPDASGWWREWPVAWRDIDRQ